ncbi:DUF924 family protein [Motiliproteus sp. SC1-56]|uniref:DUF924 family protein n=1 Tax=Motiliproteus sp. SC1-56 TaxID=2799565 RepID=UPI001A8CC3B6|nr:DUF924 family protein [Motiliproteus sp. SC1-56]
MSGQAAVTYDTVLRFWFEELSPQDRWRKDAAIDQAITSRFGKTLEAAARGELEGWRAEPAGRLAEVMVLDQFSRHIFRDQPASFAQDPQALCLAQHALALGQAQRLPEDRRAFLYMPFMHSESRLIQRRSVQLFAEPGLEESYSFAVRHRDIIERFGRFPHRNAILGRQSTAEEQEFLAQPGSSF